MFLVVGGVVSNNSIVDPGLDWLLDKSWNEICYLDTLNAYNGYLFRLLLNPINFNTYRFNYFRHKKRFHR